MIADPRAVAERWPEPRMRALAELAAVTTETPWRLGRGHHHRARSAGLSDDEVLHAIALSAFFGHLNRIADAVAVPLDYSVRLEPPHAEPATPPFLRALGSMTGPRGLALAARPATATAFAAWSAHVTAVREPLSGHHRAVIATHVGRLLGHVSDDAEPRSDLDRQLVALSELLTLAPWQVDDRAYAPLRAAGFDDAALFDACIVASSAGVWARIEVALVSLSA